MAGRGDARGRVLAALFAHPDDETFSIGGTLARCAADGVRTALYCATDGDAGRSSGVVVASREGLGALRREELAAAAGVLGIARVVAGGYPDGALATADQEALIGGIVRFLREERPAVVVTFGPEGAPTGHRDHRAISRAATAAFWLAGLPTAYPEHRDAGVAPFAPARLYYVSWDAFAVSPFPHPAGLPVSARVDVRDFRAVKQRAFEAHRSQHASRADFEALSLPPEEAYTLAAGLAQARAVAGDLFEGL